MFESSVNSEGIETDTRKIIKELLFESSVNSEGIETTIIFLMMWDCLRAV